VTKFFTPKEKIIQENLKARGFAGYYLTAGRIFQELQRRGFLLITFICNSSIKPDAS
jgi:hypothetical protein